MKAFFTSLFLVLVCSMMGTPASAQNRVFGAHELVLDDGAGHTLTIQTSPMLTNQTFTFPAVTTYTPGSVLFADGSGAINQDNAKFFWNNTSFRLGIGNAIPAYPLDVTGAINTSTVYNIGGSTVLTLASGGSNNTGIGISAGGSITTGSNNTLVGNLAGGTNLTTGFSNTIIGNNAGASLSVAATSYNNTMVGLNSGLNTTGFQNTFMGLRAGQTNTSGNTNSAFGYQADVGSGALTNATAVGANAIATASNTVQLGDGGVTLVQSHGSINTTAGSFETNGTTRIDNSGNATLGTLSAGSGKLTIDANGNPTKVNNVTTSFPASQGATGTVLTNDGSGNLSWATAGTNSAQVVSTNSTYTGGGSIGSDQNDLPISSTATYFKINSTANVNVTGVNSSGSSDGRVIYFSNVGSGGFSVTFNNLNGSSAAADQFALPSGFDVSIQDGSTAVFIYDATAQKWRLVSNN